MLIRLNKYLAARGVSSRRGADDLISAGKISVNGKVVNDLGVKVDEAKDIVTVVGKSVEKKRERYKYMLLNKPKGVVSTVDDPHAEKTVVGILNEAERLYPVGRLDKDSHGLVLLTNDGELAFRLTHPKYHIPKTYRVAILGQVRAGKIEQLRRGIELDDGVTAPAEVKVLQQEKDRTVLEIILFEGKKREIRRMCVALHLHLLDLKRVAVGELLLGELGEGKTRILTVVEIARLKKSVGL